jgi:hypothetical protein
MNPARCFAIPVMPAAREGAASSLRDLQIAIDNTALSRNVWLR